VIAWLGGVTLSVVLHAGLIAVLLAWSTADWTHPLFVDLVEPADSTGGPAAAGAPAPSPRSASRAVGARAAGPAAGRPQPAAPIAPPVAAGPPIVEPVAPAAAPPPVVASEPAPAAPPPAAPLPTPAAPPTSPGPASVLDGRSGAPDDRAGPSAQAGGSVRGDAASAPGGGPGSPLALATPGAGGGGPVPAEYGAYLRRFRQRVVESLIYPLAARRQGLAGVVELHVWLEPTGRVRDVQVARSSSHGVLDDAAVETIRRLGPVPFPDSVPRRPLLIRIPLVYELR